MPRAGDAPSRVLPGFWALKALASVPNQAGISNQLDGTIYTQMQQFSRADGKIIFCILPSNLRTAHLSVIMKKYIISIMYQAEKQSLQLYTRE